MKSVNAAVTNAIRSAYDINAVPKLTVEWNFNRYAANVSADNTPAEDTDGYDIEAFPIESIILPNRPTAGILKARVGEARVADPYTKITGLSRQIRSYLGSPDDLYKYWTSPVQTDGAKNFPNHTDGITKCRPRVDYADGVKANRIVIGFEDSFVAPNSFTVNVKTSSGGAYSTIATNPTINAQGQVILNWNTTWSSANTPSENVASLPTIYSIEVRVNSLKAGQAPGAGTGASAFLSLIEISARRVHDMSNRLVNVNDTFDMSDKSMIYPIGTLTSNTATVELYNDDDYLNALNTSSPFYGLIEPNAKFSLDWIYTINGTQYTVPEFQMYGGPWMGQNAESCSVELNDFSTYFQEIKPRAATYLNAPVSQIVWRLCDAIGFVDYQIQLNDTTADSVIKVWYTDGTKTMWELLDDLAKSTQTAIYFDSYGKLQVRTRTNAFKDASLGTQWALRAVDNGAELADIISMDQSDELSSNSIKVTYNTTDVDGVVGGQTKTQVLWQPDGTVALRACPLYGNLAATGATSFTIPPAEAKIWPYKGMVCIEGEFISYEGKAYVYYVAGVRKVAVVKSADDKSLYDSKSSASERGRNFFDGRLMITERGVWNSTNKAHYVNATGYSVRGVVNNRGHYLNLGGFSQNRTQSRVYLNPGPRFKDANDLFVVTTGSQSDPGFYQYGTQIRFEKNGGKTQQGGIVFCNQQGNIKPGNDEDGYYVDIIPTAKLTAKLRSARNEVALYVRNGGKWKVLSKGATFNIAEGVNYEIDVDFRVSGSNHVISVWINGKQAFSVTAKGGDVQPFNGKFGMFTRGDSKASFEYLYAINKVVNTDWSDDFSYLDRISGANVGGQLDREAIYGWRTIRRRVKKKWTKVKDQYVISFFDEFGPIVHEVREFDVKFTKGPALNSRLYMTNDWAVVCPEFSANSYSAHFYLANASRTTAIINGDDTYTYAGSGSSVNQILSVIGSSITVKDAESVEAKNDFQIRKRGEIQSELTGEWIQSKAMAQEIADWIKAHWSNGADEQKVTIFGNPLLEIGDIVTVDFPDLNMTAATHKYFITGIANSFDSGLESTLTLRRVT